MRKIFKTKIFIVFTILATLYLDYYLYNSLDSQKEKTYIQLSSQLKSSLEREKDNLQEIGIINAISIAEDEKIKTALLNKDRQLAIQSLETISKQYQKSTKINDLKVHIHTNETRSFVRNWKLDKFGDDLSAFRQAIVNIKETRQPTFGFEVGRMGLTLRSIVAIEHKDTFLGSLEFIQNFENVRKDLEQQNIQYLLLMDSSLINIATYLKDAPKEGNYILSLRDYDKEFFKKSQSVDFNKLERDGYLLKDDRLFTYANIKDIANNHVGIHLLSIDKTQVQTAINDIEEELFKKIVIVNLIFCFILLVLLIRKIFQK